MYLRPGEIIQSSQTDCVSIFMKPAFLIFEFWKEEDVVLKKTLYSSLNGLYSLRVSAFYYIIVLEKETGDENCVKLICPFRDVILPKCDSDNLLNNPLRSFH